MGPERDNVWREEGIVAELPAAGPKIAWRAPVAGGFAGPAVAGGKVFVTDFVTSDNIHVGNFEQKEFTGSERVLALDEATGKERWKFEYPAKYKISYPCGPRCTPAVADGKVYTLGAEGNLYAFDAESGKVLWSHDFNKEYGTKTDLWGYAGHPLVDGNKLICVVGGDGSYVVAFDKDTGKEMWKNLTSPSQGYSPPAILNIAGQRQLVLLRPDAVTALDPETGQEIWSVPYESTNGLVVMTPVLWNDYLFVGGYANKSMMLKLAADGKSAEPVWKGDPEHGFSPINVQPQARRRQSLRLRPERPALRREAPGRRPTLGHDGAGRRTAGQQRHRLHHPPGRSLLPVHRERRLDRRRPHARGLQGNQPGPHPRTDRRRLRPSGRLVFSGVRRPEDVRPQRQRMRRGGFGRGKMVV